MIRIFQLTFTKRQASHRCSADYEYKKRRKFHAPSRLRTLILMLLVCHKL